MISCEGLHFGASDLQVCKTHWHEAVSFALNFPFLKEVSQNCFVFDLVNFENCGSLAATFLALSSSKIEEVSQTCFVFDVAKFKKWTKSRRLASFSSLQIDRQTDRQADRQTDR